MSQQVNLLSSAFSKHDAAISARDIQTKRLTCQISLQRIKANFYQKYTASSQITSLPKQYIIFQNIEPLLKSNV